jgi:4-aminobutyrate aminotransferase-like enzyme
MGSYVMEKLRAIGNDCPFVSDVRGKGLMFAIDFARPKSGFLLQQKWDALHKMNFAVFGQTVIVPLLHEHRILTQVAGYHTEVIKFLPPITIGKEDLDWFLTAMEKVLGDTSKTGSTLKTIGRLAVGAARS